MPPLTRILIVEDEDILAENLQSFLARRAQDVRIAGDSNSTMKILESFTPDIVVLDFGLPGMDGLQTYAVIIRQRAPKAGCVMISGHLTDDITRTAKGHGIHHVLCKPFSFVELQDMLDLCLSNSSGYGSDTDRQTKVSIHETEHATDNAQDNATNNAQDIAQDNSEIRTADRRIKENRRFVNRRILPDRRLHNDFGLHNEFGLQMQ